MIGKTNKNQKHAELMGLYILALGVIIAGAVFIGATFTGQAIGFVGTAQQQQGTTSQPLVPPVYTDSLTPKQEFSAFYRDVVLAGAGEAAKLGNKTSQTRNPWAMAIQNGHGTIQKN